MNVHFDYLGKPRMGYRYRFDRVGIKGMLPVLWLALVLVLGAFQVTVAQVVPDTPARGAGEQAGSATAENRPLDAVLLDCVVDPGQYRVGPGDHLTITVLGVSPKTYKIVVTPEGSLIVPGLGVIDVRGMTLAEARRHMIHRLNEFYPSAELSVTLTDLRRFRVTVVGAVVRPGLHTVTASTRASEVLEAAGLTDDATRRSIQLLRDSDTIRVDLTAFERLGERDSNPYLVEGDILVVHTAGPRLGVIEISGAVNSPGEFEYVEGEHLADLIELAYGLAPNADVSRLELWRFGADDTLASLFPWPEGSRLADWLDIPLQPDDHMIVRGSDNYHRRRSVTISGEVRRPGVYVFPGGAISLRTLIDSAGGFTAEADIKSTQILRAAPPPWEELRRRLAGTPPELRSRSESDWMEADALTIPGRVSTDFVGLFERGELKYDVRLNPGDIVRIPRRSAFVNVIGRVVQPGLVAHSQGADVGYYLRNAGGYSWRADRGRTFLIKGGTGTAIKKNAIKSIEPGDMIIVPTQRPKSLWRGFRESMIVIANLATVYLVIDQATK